MKEIFLKDNGMLKTSDNDTKDSFKKMWSFIKDNKEVLEHAQSYRIKMTGFSVFFLLSGTLIYELLKGSVYFETHSSISLFLLLFNIFLSLLTSASLGLLTLLLPFKFIKSHTKETIALIQRNNALFKDLENFLATPTGKKEVLDYLNQIANYHCISAGNKTILSKLTLDLADSLANKSFRDTKKLLEEHEYFLNDTIKEYEGYKEKQIIFEEMIQLPVENNKISLHSSVAYDYRTKV